MKSYPPEQWALFVDGVTGWSNQWRVKTGQLPACWERWRLPWLTGTVVLEGWVQQARNRIKRVLTAYANGEVQE